MTEMMARLQAQGHFVLTARDGLRALELAGMFRPSVILMDVAMPHLNGVEAACDTPAPRQVRFMRDSSYEAWQKSGVDTSHTCLRQPNNRCPF
jgi:YesN/AraC family two-component response regulator